jgi:hypothetical protein
MALNALNLICDVTDPEKAGIYQSFDNNLPANLPVFVRNDGVPTTLRFVQPSVTSTRPWDDVDFSTYAVALALGVFDASPTSGDFAVQAGPTTTGNVTASSTTITLTGSTTGIVNGMYVSGPGIAPRTTITISGSDVTLSVEATTTAAGATLFFYDETAAIPYATLTTAILQTAINGLAPISAAGGVVLQGLNSNSWIATFNTTGEKDIISGDTSGLNPNTAFVSSVVVEGSVTNYEQQLLQLIVTPYALCDTWTPLPVAGAVVTQVAAGSGTTANVQSINLDPAPYDGNIQITTNLGTTSPIPALATVPQVLAALNALPGAAYTVTGNTAGPWTITSGSNGALAAYTVNVTNLLVPVGLTGILTLATLAMVEAFIAAGTANLSLKLECQAIPPGGQQDTVLQLSTIVNRNVINTNQISPTPAGNYLTAAQVAALYLALANVDTDGTLAADSDSRVASQKAVKTYISAQIADVSFPAQTIESANFTGQVGMRHQVNTSGAAITMQTPATPVAGDGLEVQDAELSWAAHNLTIAYNGTDKINGTTASFVANVSGGKLSCVYISSAYGWSIK